MPQGRPAIPAQLQRDLLEEAGFRCAIPACRVPSPLEFAHITPWQKVQEHRFDNMIVLCRNDHFRFDQGDITHQSIRNYKANLAVLNGRYSEIERRLLEMFADGDSRRTILLDYSPTSKLSFRNLVRDGVVAVASPPQDELVIDVPSNPIRLYIDDEGTQRVVPGSGERIGGREKYSLTPEGLDLVSRWFGALPISEPEED